MRFPVLSCKEDTGSKSGNVLKKFSMGRTITMQLLSQTSNFALKAKKLTDHQNRMGFRKLQSTEALQIAESLPLSSSATATHGPFKQIELPLLNPSGLRDQLQRPPQNTGWTPYSLLGCHWSCCRLSSSCSVANSICVAPHASFS